jgi:cytoskeleton protein RodZ
MELLGEYLRKERVRKNLSIEEVAESTKIKDCYVRAIEEDRFESLPSPFYIRSFLRLYVKFLNLDPDEVLSRFQWDQQDFTVKPPDVPASFVPRKRSRWTSTLFLLVFGILLATAGGYIASSLFPKRIPSLALLRPAATSMPAQVSTAREDAEEIALSQAGKGKSPEEDETTSEEMRKSDLPVYRILEAAFGGRIDTVQDRPRLRGLSTEFGCNQRVYFLTRVQTPRSGRISHVWLWEGKEIQTIDMDVEAPAWSIYSYVTVRPHQTGHWRVEVRDGSRVLFSRTFRVVDPDLLT